MSTRNLAVLCGLAVVSAGVSLHYRSQWFSSGGVMVGPQSLIATRDEFPDGRARMTIEVRNQSSSPITITDAVSSCGCTVVSDFRNKVVPPFSSLFVPVDAQIPEIESRATHVDVTCEIGGRLRTDRVQVRLVGLQNAIPMLGWLPKRLDVAIEHASNVDLASLSVDAVEYETDAPLLTGWESSSADVSVRIDNIAEEAVGTNGVVRRSYSCQLFRTTELALERECRFLVTPVTRVPVRNKDRRVVCATKPRSWLSVIPQEVVLARNESQIVVVECLQEATSIGLVTVKSNAPWIKVEEEPSAERHGSGSTSYRIFIDGIQPDINGILASSVRFIPEGVDLIPTTVPVTVRLADSDR